MLSFNNDREILVIDLNYYNHVNTNDKLYIF